MLAQRVSGVPWGHEGACLACTSSNSSRASPHRRHGRHQGNSPRARLREPETIRLGGRGCDSQLGSQRDQDPLPARRQSARRRGRSGRRGARGLPRLTPLLKASSGRLRGWTDDQVQRGIANLQNTLQAAKTDAPVDTQSPSQLASRRSVVVRQLVDTLRRIDDLHARIAELALLLRDQPKTRRGEDSSPPPSDRA